MVFRRRKITDRIHSLVDEVLHILQKESAYAVGDYRPTTIQVARLEQRVLMSASPLVVVAAATADAVESSVMQVSSNGDSADLEFTDDEQSVFEAESQWDSARCAVTESQDPDANELVESATADANQTPGPELIVIDSRVQDADTLLASLLETNRDFRLLRLDADTDGVRQITEKLEQIGNISSVHLLTHGRSGEILLGSTQLNADTLAQYAPEFLAWQHSLTANADLLLYGCDVAGSIEGQDFVDSLSELTGADVAASTNATGSSHFSGDWDLEYQTGIIETYVFGSSLLGGDWNDLLGIITVSTTNDVLDGDTSSVAALLASHGADGFISLREAIIATNNTVGADTIFLTAGTFTLSIGGQGENSAFMGDLDITDSLSITGAGSGLSIVDANALDRIFEVRAGVAATIEDVTIRGGVMLSNDWGGGVLIDNGASLNLTRAVVTGNSTGSGAGIYNYGTLVATDTIISNNTGSDWGGGLYNDRGNVTLNRVTMSGNTAGKDGGGINNAGSGASMTLTNVTLSGNIATGNGGGLWTNQSLTATNATIAFNDAASGDGIFQQGGGATVSLRNSILYNPAGVNANRGITSLGNNIDSDGTAALAAAGDQSGVNPLLDSMLQNNGGFVTTHRLLLGSAAIDAGTTVSAPTVDARNTVRDSAPDIGAFEVQGLPASRSELLVNTTTTSSQFTSSESRGSTHAVAVARDGSHVVVWSSLNQDGSGWGVYGQRFDAAGNAIGSEFLINQSTTNDQKNATVAMNGRGDFVVAWTSVNQDGSGSGVYARRYDAAGTALGNEFLVNTTTTGNQDSPVVAMASKGRFLVVWEGQGAGDLDGVFGQCYNVNGTAIGAEVLINTATSGLQGEPSVSMAPDGSAVVVWDDANGVQAQRFHANLTAMGGPINVDAWSSAGEADVEMAADGSFAVVYRKTLLDIGVYLQRYDAAGTAIGLAQVVNTRFSGNQTDPSIAMDDPGNFVVVWEGVGAGDSTGVFGRRYDASGTALSMEFLINQTTAGAQSMTSAAMLDATNYVVVWSGQGPGDSDGVFARQFSRSNFAPVITSNGGGNSAAVSIAENTTIVMTVTATDADLPAATLIYSISGGSDAARFSIDSNTGVLRFLTASDFETPTDTGSDGIYNIVVRVTDGAWADTQTIDVSVTNVNERPVANAESYSVNEDTTLTIGGAGVLTNDTDTENGALDVVLIDGVSHGNLTLNSDGSFVYTPDSNFYGQDSFRYAASDGSLNSLPIVVTLNILAVNDAPVITSNGGSSIATVNVHEYTTAVTAVTSSDVDGGIASYVIAGGNDRDLFQINTTTGILEFVTAQSFLSPIDANGDNVYEVQVRAIDGNGGSDTQSLQIHLKNVNETPLSTPVPTVSVLEDSSPFEVSVASSFTEPDLDLLTCQITNVTAGSSLFDAISIDATTGIVSLDLRANASGTSVMTLRATDPNGLFTTTQLTVIVQAVNDAPIVQNYSGSLFSGQTLSASGSGILQGAVDVEGQTIQAVLINGPQHGTVTLDSNGRFVYRPNAGYFGADSFTYAGTDGVLVGATATASINVLAPFSATTNSASSSSGSSSGSGLSSASNSGAGSQSASGSTAPRGTAASAGSTSSQTSSGTGQQSQLTGAGSSVPSNAVTPAGQLGLTAATAATSRADEDAAIDLYSQKSSASKDTLLIKTTISNASTRLLDRDESRRSISSKLSSRERKPFYSDWDSRGESTALERQREQLYLNLAVCTDQQINFFEEKLTNNVSMQGRVVGSVGVVTTGFSVGYLIWAVRGGMLLSGVLSQIPAWTMLDPLMVIDGDGKDDDKESLQTLLDRQQAKLNSSKSETDPGDG